MAKRRRKLRSATTVKFDGTPVFYGLARVLKDAREHGWSGRLNSADRRKGVAERYGKLSQAALWAGWIAHKAGFNPANPPGRSTHELRSDGTAYRGPVGRPLAYWQLGLDVSEAPELVRVLTRLKYKARRPYRSTSEAHHVNFKRSPRRRWRRRHPRRRKRVTGISRNGVALIKRFEGFRSKPYRDAVGVWTIGYGTTSGIGPQTRPISEPYAAQLLERQVNARYFPAVKALSTFDRLNQNQVDALTSFVYNLGPGAIGSDTGIGKALRAKRFRKAADEMLRWDKAGGKTLAGLTRRRKEERALFLK